ncbi:hypothetical protein AAIB41_13870 [Brucella sp. BE17]|uniref:hypothetical protein n=1 Tax=Brucella sp. BE17 TaxID=3142977 RepID=UPI0031BBBA41
MGSAVTIAACGSHAPGNSIDVKKIVGDYVNACTLHIKATSAEAHRIVVARAVDITCTTRELVLTPNDAASWDILNEPYNIIEKQSAGSVVARFDTPYMQEPALA